MNFGLGNGQAGRASARRRRAGLRSLLIVESLESRRLLAAGSLGINVVFDPYSSFVNLLQLPGRYFSDDSESSPPALDADGDPEGDASLVFDYRVNRFFNGPDPGAVPPDLSGTYHLSFTGQAIINGDFPELDTPFTVENQVYNASTNTTTANIVVPAGTEQDLFVISFLNTRATASSPIDTGFTNAKLIRPGYAADSTQLYTSEFLAALQPYGAIRYLDPDNATNQPFFYGGNLATVDSSQVDRTGVPWEYLIALANATHTDMWINVPEGATDDYVEALAEIFKNGGTVDGVAYPGLDPDLKIYLEYSDEVWGGVPFDLYYQVAAVQDTSALNDPLSTFSGNLDIYENADGSASTDIFTAVGRRYLEETADIGDIFQSVLGSDPTHERIRPVLGWAEDDASFFEGSLAWYEHFFGPADAAFYGMGDANYVDPAGNSYSSVDSVLSSLQEQEASYSIPDTIAQTTVATYYGLANVAYEGGPDVSTDGSAAGSLNGLAASRDPAMESIVLQHYLDFYAAGGTLGMYFDGPFDTWSPSNEWSAAELAQVDDPMAAAKYRGTADVASEPAQAVTAGVAVSPSEPTSFVTSLDSTGASFTSPTAGQQGYWLLNVAQAGTYDLTLSTGTWYDGMAGSVQVLVNDRPINAAVATVSASTIDLGALPLTAGLNTLSIVVNSDASGQFAPATFTVTPTNPSTSPGPSVPSWLAPNGAATYNPTTNTLTVTGAATIIADPGTTQAPFVVASGPAAVLTIRPAAVGEVNLRGITLSGGASIIVPSVGAARTHAYHVVLVLDSDGTTVPTFSIDAASKLDLADNDLIIQDGASELSAIQADDDLGRDLPAGNTWDGNGLTSSAAEAVDANAGYEQNLLALTVNSNLPAGAYSSWLAGPQVLPLGPDDVIVKYTYNGDFDLDGTVDANDAGIIGLFYGTESGATYVEGDTDGNGTVDDNDYGLFGLDYGLGTGGANGNQL